MKESDARARRYTKEAFSGAFTMDADACSLEVQDEGGNLRVRLGICEKVINIDHSHQGGANKEARVKRRRREILSNYMVGKVIEEITG